jgi:hypothetical protein
MSTDITSQTNPQLINIAAPHSRLTTAIDTVSPHWRPILTVVRDAGVALCMVPHGGHRFDPPRDKPTILVMDDDALESKGPGAFHHESLRRFVQRSSRMASSRSPMWRAISTPLPWSSGPRVRRTLIPSASAAAAQLRSAASATGCRPDANSISRASISSSWPTTMWRVQSTLKQRRHSRLASRTVSASFASRNSIRRATCRIGSLRGIHFRTSKRWSAPPRSGGRRRSSLTRASINKLAEKLVECAIEDKQSWAFQQIADRLEGKPVQVVDATVDDYRTVQEFSDAELTAILRRRLGVVPAESDDERPQGGALN